MKRALIILVLFIMSIGFSGCGQKTPNIILKEEVRANFTEEKAIKTEKLISDFINWNNNLVKVDWSDIDSINQVSSDLSLIYENYNELKDGINTSDPKGQKQMQSILPFNKIAISVNLMKYGSLQGSYGKFNTQEMKEYFLEEYVKPIGNAIDEIFMQCENEEKLRDTFVLNEEEWTNYLLILHDNLNSLSIPGDYWSNNIIQPEF